MDPQLEAVIEFIERHGWRNQKAVENLMSVTSDQIAQWVSEGHLCILSGGQVDTPRRRDERLAYETYLNQGGHMNFRSWKRGYEDELTRTMDELTDDLDRLEVAELALIALFDDGEEERE